jgi:hypothetical protein
MVIKTFFIQISRRKKINAVFELRKALCTFLKCLKFIRYKKLCLKLITAGEKVVMLVKHTFFRDALLIYFYLVQK